MLCKEHSTIKDSRLIYRHRLEASYVINRLLPSCMWVRNSRRFLGSKKSFNSNPTVLGPLRQRANLNCVRKCCHKVRGKLKTFWITASAQPCMNNAFTTQISTNSSQTLIQTTIPSSESRLSLCPSIWTLERQQFADLRISLQSQSTIQHRSVRLRVP